jgi:hypothetical protein
LDCSGQLETLVDTDGFGWWSHQKGDNFRSSPREGQTDPSKRDDFEFSHSLDPKLPLANAESGLSGIAENDRLTPLLSGVE